MIFFAPLVAALGTLVATSLGFWLVSAIASIGLTLAVQHFALDPALQSIQNASNGMGAMSNAVAWFRFLGGDKFITIICSAYAAAALTSAIRVRRA